MGLFRVSIRVDAQKVEEEDHLLLVKHLGLGHIHLRVVEKLLEKTERDIKRYYGIRHENEIESSRKTDLEMMKNPSVQNGGVLRGKVLDARVVRLYEDILGRASEHVEDVRRAPGPGVSRPVEDGGKVDRVLLPARGDGAQVLVEAGDHGHVTGPRLSWHLSIRHGERCVAVPLLASKRPRNRL